MLVEPFIKDYVKFNSNTGWACSTDGWAEVSWLLQLICRTITMSSKNKPVRPQRCREYSLH